MAHDNEGLRAELARVQGELSALAAQQEAAARQQEAAAAAAAAELAALQRRSAGLAAQHEVTTILTSSLVWSQMLVQYTIRDWRPCGVAPPSSLHSTKCVRMPIAPWMTPPAPCAALSARTVFETCLNSRVCAPNLVRVRCVQGAPTARRSEISK